MEFDLIIYTLKGSDILKDLNRYKYNLYHYPGKEINEDLNYRVIWEIKTNFFRQIKDANVQKQFKKYKIILEILSSKPNLENIKKKIGLNGKNQLIFILVTDGDFFQFDYMMDSLFKFKEDCNMMIMIKNLIVTDGDFFQFDYMMDSLFKFKEDCNMMIMIKNLKFLIISKVLKKCPNWIF